MKCPKCGYQRQHRDDLFVAASECPACGVVYTKYTAPEPPAVQSMESGRETDASTSPVHADSLRQARERVEMRLRKQANMRLQDTRKAQTLERARHIAAEAMRQRQAQGPIRSEAALAPIDTVDDLWVPAPVASDEVIESAGEPALETERQPIPDTESDTLKTPLDSYVKPSTEASTDIFSLPRLLPLVAWLALGVGVSGALLTWITVDTGQAVAGNGPGNTTGPLPVAFLLGFAYLATGVLGFGVFWVASVITHQLEDIRARLFSQSAQMSHTGDASEPNGSQSQLTR